MEFNDGHEVAFYKLIKLLLHLRVLDFTQYVNALDEMEAAAWEIGR